MSKKILISLFLVSVVFNFAFLGTFLFHHFFSIEHRPIEPAFHGRIPLHMRENFRQNREKLEPLHKDFMDSKKNFMQSLWSEDFDREISMEKLDETIKKQVIMEHKLGASLIRLRESITDDEAKKLLMNRDRFKSFRKNNLRRK